MIAIIEVGFPTIKAYRSAKNVEIFANGPMSNVGELLVHAGEGLVMRCRLDLSDQTSLGYWNSILPYTNKPVILYDKRIVSHDFSDNTSWADPANSTFTVQPDPAFKYILTHSIVRFPDNLKLVASNTLTYEVWLSPDGINPPTQPLIALTYDRVIDLFRKATAPFTIAPSVVPELGPNREVEVLFQYSNPYRPHEGSPIILRSSLNEKIVIHLEAHQPLMDNQNPPQPLLQECTIAMNFKKTLEF